MPEDNYFDVDSLRGAVDQGTKPFKHANLVWAGLFKILTFPFHYKWWLRRQMPLSRILVSSALYVTHLGLCVTVFLRDNIPGCPPEACSLAKAEILIPVVLLVVYGIGYGSVLAAGGHGDLPRTGTTAGQAPQEEDSDSEDSEHDEPEDVLVPTSKVGHVKDRADEDEDEDDVDNWERVVKPLKVSIWDKGGDRRKVTMELSQLRSIIFNRACQSQRRPKYSDIPFMGTLVTAALPALFRWWTKATVTAVVEAPAKAGWDTWLQQGWGQTDELQESLACDLASALTCALCTACIARLAYPIFSELAASELTYQRRYKYAKYWNSLTSSTRAKKYRLPHFSLKNVANIRAWLALRAGKLWLRRHPHQRTADAVATCSFFLVISLVAVIIVEALAVKEVQAKGGSMVQQQQGRMINALLLWELLAWCAGTGLYLLRFLTLGARINNRYRDTSVLLTEQINVQLRLLQSGGQKEKRDKLVISGHVLKIAGKLLKELEGPNKISGLSMSPMLYNITRMVLLSALSAVMTELLGFKLPMWKLMKMK